MYSGMKREEHGSIEFTKMSGAGNDFVVMDNRSGVVAQPADLARVLCDRRKGIGADGLLLLEKSDRADFLMRYFNSDGSYGGMCGNGGRCISRYAQVKHIVNRSEMRFEALEHIYTASILHDDVRLSMKDPADFRINRSLTIGNSSLRFHYVNSGSPHCVFFLDENNGLLPSLNAINVEVLGREIRNHVSFSPEGANVSFVEQAAANSFSVRTYERGVEAETLACGTGAVAVGLLSCEVKNTTSPISLRVRSGEILTVEFLRTGPALYKEVSLRGSAHIVFNGVVNYEFSSHSILDTE